MEKGGWIAVVVALITTAGVVISKYLEVAKPVVAAPDKPAPIPSPQPAVDPAPAPAPAKPVVADAPVAEDETPAPPVKRRTVEISGTWVDNGGMSLTVEQSGATFRMTAAMGNGQVYAQGAIVGRELRWTYTNSLNNPGQCVAQLLPGDDQLTASCQQMSGPPYMMQLTRAG